MTTINIWAVLVGAIINMIIGSLWYSPVLFGKAWMKLVGLTQKDIKKAQEKGMGKTYLIAFLNALIMAAVLSVIISYVGKSALMGLKTGLLIWLGFVMTIGFNIVLWEQKPMKLFLIHTSYYLVTLPILGLVLGSW